MTAPKHGIYVLSNEPVTILSIIGGWTTYKNEAGETKKARNSLIRAVESNTPAKAKPAKAPIEKEGDEPELEVREPALVQPDYARYTKHKVKSPSGRSALDISDKVADILRGNDISDCHYIVAKHMAAVKGETRSADDIEKELTEQYKHLNIGMQRMNLGNRLRKVLGLYGNLNAHKTPRVAKSVDDDKKTIYVKPGTEVTVKIDRRKSER